MERSDEQKQGESDEHWKARLERNRVQREWQAAHPGYDSSGRRARHLKHKYGATVEEVESKLAAQGYACAICGRVRPLRQYRHGGFLQFDHNHKTGQHRAMLCLRCNGVVGLVEDHADLIEAARLYLQSYA